VTLAGRGISAGVVGLVAILLGAAVAGGQAVPLLEGFVAVGLAAVVVAASNRPVVAVSALAFALGCFPVARLVVHGVPIYATDVLALLLVVWAVRANERISGYGWVVIAYLVSWVPAWLHQVISLHLVLAPGYGLVRNALAVGVFFPAYLLGRRGTAWLGALAAGASISALLAVFQAAAPGPANGVLSALAPSFTSTALRTYPHRAFSLFSAPTTLAGFLCMAILLFVASGRRRLVLAALLSTLGLVATYSRQWVPALVAGLVALAWLRLGVARRVIAFSAVALAAAWLVLAIGTLNGSYLGERFTALRTGDVNVQTRLTRQKAFVELARQEPATFVVGKGFAGQDLVERGLVDTSTASQLRSGLNDDVFLLEVFNHGIVAGVLYLSLFVAALVRTLGAARRATVDSALLAGIGAALAAALVLQISDNYFSESVFMKAFLWLLIGTGIGLADRERRTER
jgi:hypothetical protein